MALRLHRPMPSARGEPVFRAAVAIVAFAAATVVPRAAAQPIELVTNGGFDGGTAGWEVVAGDDVSATFEGGFDCEGVPGSGSVVVVVDTTDRFETGLSQCVPIAVTGAQRITATYRFQGVGDGVPGDGTMRVGMSFHAGAACDGALLGTRLADVTLPETSGCGSATFLGWSMPASTASMLVELAVSIDPGSFDTDARFDDVSIVTLPPDLAVSLVAPAVEPAPGDSFVLELRARNLGAPTLTGTVVAAELDPAVVFLDVGACAGSLARDGTTLTWEPGPVPPSMSRTCEVELFLPFTTRGTVEFAASGTYDREELEDELSNNAAVASVDIVEGFDLDVDLAGLPSMLVPADTTELAVAVGNSGNLTAENLFVALGLPDGLDLLSAGDCEVARDPGRGATGVGILFGALGPGTEVGCTIEIGAAASASGVLTVLAQASATDDVTLDFDLSNNATTAGVTVAEVAFTVDDPVDAVDAVPGDGACATAGAVCSLRAAVMEANALAGPGLIELPAGTYALTLAGAGSQAGDLDLTDDVTIRGTGASRARIVGPGSRGSAGERVFDVDGGAVVTLEHVEIAGGVDAVGGGVRQSNGVGHLSLRDCRLTENGADVGGGIHASGSLEVVRCVVDGNAATDGAGLSLASLSEATIRDTTFHDNDAEGAGGGILALGLLRAANTTISANRAGEEGAGLYVGAAADVELENATVAFNEAGPDDAGAGDGGGVFVEPPGSLDIASSVLVGNVARIVAEAPSGASCAGDVDSAGFNSIDPAPDFPTCAFDRGTGDRFEATVLDPLAGDPELPVHPLRAGAAIDGGDPAGCRWDDDANGNTPEERIRTDQTGAPRAQDGDGDGFARCDAGAVERPSVAIFASDFEAGSTEDWSNAVP